MYTTPPSGRGHGHRLIVGAFLNAVHRWVYFRTFGKPPTRLQNDDRINRSADANLNLSAETTESDKRPNPYGKDTKAKNIENATNQNGDQFRKGV